MSEPNWDVAIYKAVDPGEEERRFVVVTTIGEANPVVHFCASREEAERSKYRTLEILWGAQGKESVVPKSGKKPSTQTPQPEKAPKTAAPRS